MKKKQKIQELFIEEKKFRLINHLSSNEFNESKLGQTLKCFSLDKNKNQQSAPLLKQRKKIIIEGLTTPTRKQSQKLERLLQFYQSQKAKNHNKSAYQSQKYLMKKETVKSFFQNFKTDNILLTAPPKGQHHENSTSQLYGLNFSFYNNNQQRKNQKKIVFGDRQSRQKLSRQQFFTQRNLLKIEQLNENNLESIMRTAFIPAYRLKSSSKKVI